MARRIWYTVWGQGEISDEPIELARVRSVGLANLIAHYLKQHYRNVTVK